MHVPGVAGSSLAAADVIGLVSAADTDVIVNQLMNKLSLAGVYTSDIIATANAVDAQPVGGSTYTIMFDTTVHGVSTLEARAVSNCIVIRRVV